MHDDIDDLEKEIEDNIKKHSDNEQQPKKKKILRLEYKVLLFFILIFLFYSLYSFFTNEILPKVMDSSSVGKDITTTANKSTSIAEAVNAERPIILDSANLQATIDKMKSGDNSIIAVEKASDSQTPTIWIYVHNDGMRKDELATKYCDWFKSNKIVVTSVMVLDNEAKSKGKIIELGEKRCM